MNIKKNTLRTLCSLLMLTLVLSTCNVSANAADISDEQLRIIKERTVQAMENMEDYVDLTDLNITVNMYADRFSPEYQKILDLLEKTDEQHGSFYMGSHRESFCSAGAQTQPSKGNNSPYGTGKNDLTGIIIDYDALYCDEYGKPNREKLLEMKDVIQRNYQFALNAAHEEMSDVEKALAVYDYLIAFTNYPDSIGVDPDGHDVYENKYHDVANLFYEGVSVCSANSTAYAYLLSDLGIPVVTLTSSAMDHEWPMVKLDGKWYHADLTWDDPRYTWGSTSQGNYNADAWDLGFADHTYFLKSDKEISDLMHYDWELLLNYSDMNNYATPKAKNSNAYADAFFSPNHEWCNQTSFQYISGRWYACDPCSGKILDVKYGDEKNARLFSPVNDWIKYAYAWENALYLCTGDMIYRYLPETEKTEAVLRSSDFGGNAVFSEMRITAGRMDLVILLPGDSPDDAWTSIEKSMTCENLALLPALQ